MMKEQWDPSTPIIYLFSKIQDGVDKADAGNAPYTVNWVLAITFNHVFRVVTIQSACERWTALAPMNKIWVNFQDTFTSAHETYETLTAQTGGFHGADNVQAQETEKFYNETAEAFENLAMAATADKDLLSKLTNTSPPSPTIPQQRKKSLRYCRSSYGVAEPQLRNKHTTNRQHPTRLNATAGRTESLYPVTTTAPSVPGEGHKCDATREKKMGGGCMKWWAGE
jgi:hypothetical protein